MSKAQSLKIVAAAAGLALIGTVVALFPIREWLRLLLEAVQGIGIWGALLLGVAYIPASVLLVPGSLLTLGAGFLFGVLLGTVVVSLGSTAGATVAFLVGRKLARDWVAARVARSRKFQAIDRAVGKEGFKIVLLTRLSPVFPFNLLNYAYGITNVSLRDYVLASWIGMLPGTVMYVYVGSAAKNLAALAAGEAEAGWGQQALYGVGLLATVVVVLYVTRVARSALRESVGVPKADGEGASPA